jgi:hypothetical protein
VREENVRSLTGGYGVQGRTLQFRIADANDRTKIMPKLRQLSLINCSSLTTIGSLAALPSLQVVKLEGCNSLAALPKLPHANAKWDDDSDSASFSFLAPQHLRTRVESGG